MRKFSLLQFYLGILRLQRYIRALEDFTDEPDSHLVMSEHLKQLKQDGAQVATALDTLRFSDTPNIVSRLQTFAGTLNNLTREQMILQSKELEHAIYSDIGRLALAVLRTDQDAAIADLCQTVNIGFPKAKEDAEFAGECYRIEAFDACIFHLLRVLEHGLRKMAQDLRVKSYHTGVIEMRDWGTLIDEIQSAVKALPRDTLEAREYKERQAMAATHFLFIKDVWRNVYYHARNSPTSQEQASQFLGMTKTFMRVLGS